MSQDKRRDDRYPVQIAVRLFLGKEVVDLRSHDVSFRGVFLRTDSPPQLRRLVRIEATLPSGVLFTAHGMAVHVVELASSCGRTPGVGVQFYALDAKQSEIWSMFIREVRESMINTPEEVKVLAGATFPDPIRRRYPRHKAPLEVRYRSFDDMYRAYARDVSRGGLFVATDHDLPPGSEVVLTLVRPGSTAFFEVDGIVRRRVEAPGSQGVGVEFVNMSRDKQEALHRFIAESVPTLEELHLIEEGDPRLA